jgi:CLIP-associating protein 1/2
MTKRQVVVSKSTHSFGDQNSPKSHIKTSVSFSATSDLYEYETTKSGRNGDSRTVPGGEVQPHQPSRKGGSRGTLDRLVQLTHPSSTTSSNGKPVDPFADAMKSLSVKGSSVELRLKSLQTLLGLARNPTHCNWEEHSSRVLHKLMELMQDESGEVKVLALRVFREVVKVKPDVLKNVTELVITKVLKSCQDKEAHKTAAEDVLPILSENVDPIRALPQLIQLITVEEYPEVLSSMKMMSIVIPRCGKDLLTEHIKDLMSSLLKLFGHAESTVRKSSVFCLVAVHKVVQDDIDAYLITLTTSQRKLLDIYIKKSQTSSTGSTSSS